MQRDLWGSEISAWVLTRAEASILVCRVSPPLPSHRGTVALWIGSLTGEGTGVKFRRIHPPPIDRSAFTGYRFPPEVIMLAVRWYLRHGLSSHTTAGRSGRQTTRKHANPKGDRHSQSPPTRPPKRYETTATPTRIINQAPTSHQRA
jgi:hypothetical protein